ncbi:autoinducer binding domain-containing protein [Ideonella sp. B7]|uniref:autoinducer binding domain-containing protein n=1 Tax=Ideonella benzenivorans TaxID=2831643 RepID=UPI001CEDDA56|nr:autoinducer binding domain-containing protein [Ideonella benzenivorans]MCA6218373.1 autoinducer binding domain-containing protein [Ideonella benzenivorans]
MSAGLLHGSFLSVMQADTEAAFRQEVIRFANDLGFDYVSAMTVVDQSLAHSEFYTVDNTPRAYKDGFQNSQIWRQDPVMQHCKRGTVPILWDQATYVRNGVESLWEEQAAFGYRTGVALAMHLPQGRHFMLGVDRDQALPADATALTRIVADLQLFAVHAQDAALRLFVPPDVMALERPKLTPRELEALRWTMEGKTAWEVGTILGISERTAVLHLQNAMHKLESTNKHQAVLKALRLGLIH